MEKKYRVYIDGSKTNQGDDNIGGWAFVIVDDKNNIVKKNYGKIGPGLPNPSVAELEALYQALKWINKSGEKSSYHFITDYEVIKGCLEGDYKRSGNRGYWDVIEPLCNKMVGLISIEHMKSHSKDETEDAYYNNMVDKLAKKGANSLLIKAINVRN